MPYVSDIDFDKAIAQQIVSPTNKEYQLRFNYWIDQFEAYYGNIVQFYKDMEITKAEKLVLINNLITDLISKQLIVKKDEPSNLA
jgi:predicted extracellular nuclease